ncbi:MAG: RecX family transcriptional regulator [Chloroflexota bacterium]|nr:RecX family transcriptional regulator [Chloroflexota bacterium]
MQRRLDPAERRAQRAEIQDPEVVMDAAAVFLAVRPRSVAETRRRLRHHGYPSGLVDSVIERLVALSYLDDEAFARAWVESRDRSRPRGWLALRLELESKGVERRVVDLVIAERDGTDLTDGVTETSGAADRLAAERLLERRRASLEREPDLRRRGQKAYALLARNGFEPTTCAEAATGFSRSSQD